jgi:streptomycin 6-kinase
MGPMPPIQVPSVVRRTALDHEHGAAWLAGIDELVAGLANDWQLSVGDVFGGGTASVVLGVTTATGEAAVLKVAPDDLTTEARTLELADGRGCARLLRQDLERGALLLERLGRPLDALGLSTDDNLRAIAATVQQLWIPVTDDAGLTMGDDKGRWLADLITEMWEGLDRPCSERTVDRARAYAQRRVDAFDRDRAVLVHGDAHQWNTLEAGAGSYKLVDPDGLCADREYDLAIPIREVIGTPQQGRLWCHLLAGLTDTDATAIWEWGFVERVSTGLLCVKHGIEPSGARMLAIADAWAL